MDKGSATALYSVLVETATAQLTGSQKSIGFVTRELNRLSHSKRKFGYNALSLSTGLGTAVGGVAITAVIAGTALAATPVGWALLAAGGAFAGGYAIRKVVRNLRSAYYSVDASIFEAPIKINLGTDWQNGARYWIQKNKLSTLVGDAKVITEASAQYQKLLGSGITSCPKLVQVVQQFYIIKAFLDVLSKDALVLENFFDFEKRQYDAFQKKMNPREISQMLVMIRIWSKMYLGDEYVVLNHAMQRVELGKKTYKITPLRLMKNRVAHVKSMESTLRGQGQLDAEHFDVSYLKPIAKSMGITAGMQVGTLGGKEVGLVTGLLSHAENITTATAMTATAGSAGLGAVGALISAGVQAWGESYNTKQELAKYTKLLESNSTDKIARLTSLRTILKDSGVFERVVDHLIKIQECHATYTRLSTAQGSWTEATVFELAVAIFRSVKHLKSVYELFPYLEDFVAQIRATRNILPDTAFPAAEKQLQQQGIAFLERHPHTHCTGYCVCPALYPLPPTPTAPQPSPRPHRMPPPLPPRRTGH